jgi:hypothetical protein
MKFDCKNFHFNCTAFIQFIRILATYGLTARIELLSELEHWICQVFCGFLSPAKLK